MPYIFWLDIFILSSYTPILSKTLRVELFFRFQPKIQIRSEKHRSNIISKWFPQIPPISIFKRNSFDKKPARFATGTYLIEKIALYFVRLVWNTNFNLHNEIMSTFFVPLIWIFYWPSFVFRNFFANFFFFP